MVLKEPAVVSALEYLHRETGICIPDHRVPVLGAVLKRLAAENGGQAEDFETLRRKPEVMRQLLHAVVVPETFLFRHFGHYEALAELATQRFQQGRPLHVLSAGCATGEEVWSAAAVLARVFLPQSRRFSVEGWDIDSLRIRQAGAGTFRDWSARSGLYGYTRFFRRIARGWEIDESLRPFVRFLTVNLVAGLPADHVYDAVFFRNVAIYWDAETTRRVVIQLVANLAEDGLLFVGPADPVDLSHAWTSSIVDGALLYRRGAEPAKPPEPRRQKAKPRLGVHQRPARFPALQDRRSVPAPPRPVSPPETAPAEPERTWFEEAQELADRGLTAEALALIEDRQDRLPPEARVLAGVLLLELDRVDEAIVRFRQAVFLDGGEGTYRIWLAVALERAGRSAEAEREYRNARELSQKQLPAG